MAPFSPYSFVIIEPLETLHLHLKTSICHCLPEVSHSIKLPVDSINLLQFLGIPIPLELTSFIPFNDRICNGKRLFKKCFCPDDFLQHIGKGLIKPFPFESFHNSGYV